ncbi:hypothetical protein [Sphingomonas sp. VNH70]|uniref:hypothetical protein n=1 Tax=Sphingomonas silueang TaxID=3156617 RepID=UPI0032B482E5
MKGSILAIGEDGGLILGEDGARYAFGLHHWRSETPARIGEPVDFVATGTTATDVFALRQPTRIGTAVKQGMAAIEQTLEEERGGEVLSRVRGLAAERPHAVVAGLLLLASIALSWASFGGPGAAQRLDGSLLSMPDLLGDLREQVDTAVTGLEQLLGNSPGSPFRDTGTAARLAVAKRALLLLRLAPMLYLVPVGAIAILILAWKGRRMRLVELATGLLAAGSVVTVLLSRQALAGAVADRFGAAMLRSLVQVEAGGWLAALCGIGLILTALGIVRRTPGL